MGHLISVLVYTISPYATASREVTATIVSRLNQILINDTLWYENDMIGISTAPGTLTCYVNIPYLYSRGTFSAYESMIFFQSTETVTFNAYFPYTASGGIISFTTDIQFTLADQRRIDFMYSYGSTASSDNPELDLVFIHSMSYLIISLELGTGVNSQQISISLTGLSRDGVFNTETGVASATEDSSVWDITNNYHIESNNNKTLTYPMIIIPQTVSNGVTVTVMTNDGMVRKETLQFPEDQISSSQCYEFNLKTTSTLTYTKSDTYTKSNTYTKSDTIKLNTISISNTSLQINAFTDSHSLTLNSFILTYSNVIIETITFTIFVTNTLLFYLINSSYFSTFTEFIFYDYISIRFPSYNSFYVLFPYSNDINNSKVRNLIIIIVVCALVVIAIITFLVILLIRNRNKNNKEELKSKSTNSTETETNNNFIQCLNMSHIDEDPFANDFKEENHFDKI